MRPIYPTSNATPFRYHDLISAWMSNCNVLGGITSPLRISNCIPHFSGHVITYIYIYISGSNSIHMKSVKAKSMEKESKVLHGKIKQYLRRETKTNNSKVT